MPRKAPPPAVANRRSDEAKAIGPDKLRNDKALWKDHDQPDTRHPQRPDPEKDYPDAGVAVPRKR
ncbi:hypothetical protein [Pseudoxanthomonas suwonensis]|uniref:hypothetical protein n=1 Tax=Pseudoxanthomonas suwonensis TaxID=314722 RepID=UPI000B0C0445|nr:hypothetical protein [Pseudoxanthomonas suwonensis]